MGRERLNLWLGGIFGILALAGLTASTFAEDVRFEHKSKALSHYIMGVVNDLNGRGSQAVSEYDRSVNLNPTEPAPHLRLGAYYARLGQLDEAEAQMKTVLKLSPGETQAHYLLALIYSSQKKFDLAASEYEYILKSVSKNNPDSTEIHLYLAQLYSSQHKYPEAIVQFQRILKLNPDNVSANYLLGSIYLEQEDREQAKAYFKKVLTVEPDHDQALNSLAYMYAEDGVNLDEALKMVRKAIAIDPTSGAYYDSLGWVLYKKEMNGEALMALQKAETLTQDPLIYEHMGDVYKAVKEFALARKFWRKSLELEPDQPQVLNKINELGKASAKIDNLDEKLPAQIRDDGQSSIND